MYYEQHLKQTEIAKIVGSSKQYISKVINQDKRNIREKESRKEINKEKRKEYKKKYFLSYTRPKKEDTTYEQLLALQRQDSIEMSYFNNGNLSNQDYLKWNRSAYTQTKKGNMVLDKTLNVGFTTPKYISMKAKVPTQKYKHRDCFSR